MVPDGMALINGREAGSARITYSTEFLLSVGGSDHCKKLPVGIDATVLRCMLC